MGKSELQKLNDECAEHFKALYPGEEKILVFGEGARRAALALVGEAPGGEETLKRRPFVGRAGRTLDEFLSLINTTRSDIYVTNVVKIRPVRQSAAGRIVNRPPTREEISLFTPWLSRELNLLRPKIIATLGNVPLRALSGLSKLTIGEEHGKPRPWDGRPRCILFPLYHPASLLYNPALADMYREDIFKLKALYDTILASKGGKHGG